MDTSDFTNNQGECPKCGLDGDFEYGKCELVEDMCYFPWECKNCGLQGEEYYRLEFSGHNVFTKDGDVIEL